jgi:hypothetical protein
MIVFTRGYRVTTWFGILLSLMIGLPFDINHLKTTFGWLVVVGFYRPWHIKRSIGRMK